MLQSVHGEGSLTCPVATLGVAWEATWGCLLEQFYMASAYGQNSPEHGSWDAGEKEGEKQKRYCLF